MFISTYQKPLPISKTFKVSEVEKYAKCIGKNKNCKVKVVQYSAHENDKRVVVTFRPE